MGCIFDCNCRLCTFLESYNGPSGGWCDPRRHYHESEDEFIDRVPDGILKWPYDHVDKLKIIPIQVHVLQR